MGSGSSCCSCQGGVWKADGFSDSFNAFALHNLTELTVQFAVYYKKIEIAKPNMKVGYLRKGVVRGPNDDPRMLDAEIAYVRWRPDYEEANDDDPPHVMDLELQHALVIFQKKLDSGVKHLALSNPPGYATYKITRPVSKAWEKTKDAFMSELNEQMTKGLGEYKYTNRQAVARYSKELPELEQEYLTHRQVKTREALGKFLGVDLSNVPYDQIPRIGIACSGGGYRAMLASLGVLIELEKAGVLDCVTYTAGLSGGSWLLTHVYSSPAGTLQLVLDNLKAKLSKDFYTSDLFPKTVLQDLRERIAQDNEMGLVDDFSWHLHHHMYRDFPAKKELWDLPRLSEQTEKVGQGQMPLPVYTAVTAVEAGHYRWLELTPYEAGIRDDINSFIPTWAFGRKFKDGVSVTSFAEPSMPLMAGVLGSAFCATVDQIFANLIDNDTLAQIMHYFLYKQLPTIGDERIFTPAHFPNFAEKGALSHVENLAVMDAGCAFNVPLPPLLRPERGVDVIIALDQSAGRDQLLTTNLALARDYAAAQGWAFPDVSTALELEKKQNGASGRQMSAASTRPLTVCPGDVATNVPTILWMALLRDERFHPTFDPRTADFCSTTNWIYKPEEIDLLSGLTAYNTANSIDQIKTVLRATLDKKMAAGTLKLGAAAIAAQAAAQQGAQGSPVPATPSLVDAVVPIDLGATSATPTPAAVHPQN